jgi:hypothetical protein
VGLELLLATGPSHIKARGLTSMPACAVPECCVPAHGRAACVLCTESALAQKQSTLVCLLTSPLPSACVRIYVCVCAFVPVYAKQQISNGNVQMMDGDVSGPADASLATDISVVTDVSTDSSACQDSPGEYASVEKVLGADKDEAKEESNTTPTRDRLLSSSMVSDPEEEKGAELWSPKVDDGAKVRCTERPCVAACGERVCHQKRRGLCAHWCPRLWGVRAAFGSLFLRHSRI